MRRIQKEDQDTMKLLNEGATAAAGKADTDRKLQELHERMRLMSYSVANVLRTLGSYSAVKAQVESTDYRTLGLIRVMKKLHPEVDIEALIAEEALAVQVEAFEELSAKDDEDRKLAKTDDQEVSLDHYVVFTTECPESPEQGVFRSKMDVSGEEFAGQKDVFLGKKVGETFETQIRGQKHLATILGLRKKPDATTQE